MASKKQNTTSQELKEIQVTKKSIESTTQELEDLLKSFDDLKARNKSLDKSLEHEELFHDEKSKHKKAEKEFSKKLAEIEELEKDASKYNERLSKKYQQDYKKVEKELTKEQNLDTVNKKLEDKIKQLELENADLKHATKVYSDKLSTSEKRKITTDEEFKFHDEGISLIKDGKELFINWRKTTSDIGKEINNKYLAHWRTPLLFIGMILLLCTIVGIFYVYYYSYKHDHKISKVALKAALVAGYKPITQVDRMKVEKYNFEF